MLQGKETAGRGKLPHAVLSDVHTDVRVELERRDESLHALCSDSP